MREEDEYIEEDPIKFAKQMYEDAKFHIKNDPIITAKNLADHDCDNVFEDKERSICRGKIWDLYREDNIKKAEEIKKKMLKK